jgi:hypothetical protein
MTIDSGLVRDTNKETCDPARLPSQLAGRWGKMIVIVYGEEKCVVLGRLEQPRQEKSILYWHDNPRETTKKGLLSFVFFESPFTSVSTVSRGHPPIVSLGLVGKYEDSYT